MDPKRWNRIIGSFPLPHILQSYQWGQVKTPVGWQPHFRVWGNESNPDAAALILLRAIPIAGFAARLQVMYIPKGPLLRDWGDASLRGRVLSDLREFGRQKGAIFIKIDPDVPLGWGISGTESCCAEPVGANILQDFADRGWQFSEEQVQFRNTVLIDLTLSEDDLLANMKQKTRYNVRLAGRRGVVVRSAFRADFSSLYDMYAETSLRDGFAIRGQDYYENLWGIYWDAGLLDPLIAEVEGEAVAAVVIFRFANRAYYMQGMSRNLHRNKMPTFLLQWEAMRRAKAVGCAVYDLWGAPEVFNESDSMWGVYRFKEGLGGEVFRSIGAYDLPLRPFYYRLYIQILPRILDVMRNRGRKRTERLHQG